MEENREVQVSSEMGRLENCLEELNDVVDVLSNRLTSVKRRDSPVPAKDSTIKETLEVELVPLAQRVRDTVERVKSAIKKLDNLNEKLEI